MVLLVTLAASCHLKFLGRVMEESIVLSEALEEQLGKLSS